VKTRLKGVIPALPTPFDADGEIDEAAFGGVVRFMLGKGVHGMCVGGPTGEGHTLEKDEFRRLNAIAMEEVQGRVPVVAGIIANSTREVIARARAVAGGVSDRGAAGGVSPAPARLAGGVRPRAVSDR
jgi:4-hydroxy-tetrahydrodipicolinate synthase